MLDEIKELIMGVQIEKYGRTEAPQAYEEEDIMRPHDTVCLVVMYCWAFFIIT